MSATIIAFTPRQHRPAAGANDYAFLLDHARRWLAEQRTKEALATATPARPTAEDEILKLLRRIDRRLSKIAAA